jgi:hypothetical protein
MTKKESLGFWRDMIDWYNDDFEGTENQGGKGAGKEHPKGCRGCSDQGLSWWCNIYFIGLVIYEITAGIISIPCFLIKSFISDKVEYSINIFKEVKTNFKMCGDCKYFAQCDHHYVYPCISGMQQIEPCKTCNKQYPNCNNQPYLCEAKRKYGYN